MRFRTWPVAAIALGALLILVVISVLESSRRAQEIYTRLDALNDRIYPRLNNGVYRAGFAESRDMARQLVRHGHIRVNGRKVDIPSYRVSENDIVEVAEKSRTMLPFEIAQARAGERPVPPWLEVISSQLRVLVHSIPARQVIDTPVQEQLIVELYSK